MIVAADLITLFRRMYKEHWAYKWNTSEAGCVDCSGAFVWAYRQFRATIAHGSNSIARKHCLPLRPISQAKPGYAAFKVRQPGDENYKLPDKFKRDKDLTDYYHIGLVDTDGTHVLNAQSESAGFTRTKLSSWGAVAPLKYVQYPESNTKERDSNMETMIVSANSGSTVRVRKSPSTRSAEITALKIGTVVTAEEEESGWRRIAFDGGKTGYMMARYLVPQTESQPPVTVQPVATSTDLQTPPPGDDTFVTVTMTRGDYAKLTQARDLLIEALGVG